MDPVADPSAAPAPPADAAPAADAPAPAAPATEAPATLPADAGGPPPDGPGLALPLIGALLLLGLLVAALTRLRGRPRAAPALVEMDEVGRLKELVEQLTELEEELVVSGQALGRVRRFLPDPGEADAATAQVRGVLAEVWLRRHDLQGRLRLAALRRRVPAPPGADALVGPAPGLRAQLEGLAAELRLLSGRADDSARMLRQIAPADDPHARWVADAVDAATVWRASQVEDVLRFAGRMLQAADRVDDCAAALDADGALEPERVHALLRLALEDRGARELDDRGGTEADLERVLARAREAARAARELARRAATRRPGPEPVERAG
jgi:hypothetical protein